MSTGTADFGELRNFIREMQRDGLLPRGSRDAGGVPARLSLENAIDIFLAILGAVRARDVAVRLPVYRCLRELKDGEASGAFLHERVIWIAQQFADPDSNFSKSTGRLFFETFDTGGGPVVTVDCDWPDAPDEWCFGLPSEFADRMLIEQRENNVGLPLRQLGVRVNGARLAQIGALFREKASTNGRTENSQAGRRR